jgi:putative ABC transport system permease protein
MKFVMAGYFQTMRTPIIHGASFGPDESVALPNAVVVSAAYARRYSPRESPIGKSLSRLEADGKEVRAVRETIREVDAALSVARIRPMDAILTRSVATERFLASLLLVAAGVSLFLCAIGVYGVAAQAVRRREQEFGIRVTLGARPGQVVDIVLKESLAFVLMGAVVGLATAVAAGRALRAFLFEVSATDPATAAAVTALIIAVALIACLVPARRALRLDPIAALRG